MNDKGITPYNNKGQRHEYWEMYYYDGYLRLKGFYHNGKLVGYNEWFSHNSILNKKKYNI
jgi:hypothetical protein